MFETSINVFLYHYHADSLIFYYLYKLIHRQYIQKKNYSSQILENSPIWFMIDFSALVNRNNGNILKIKRTATDVCVKWEENSA